MILFGSLTLNKRSFLLLNRKSTAEFFHLVTLVFVGVSLTTRPRRIQSETPPFSCQPHHAAYNLGYSTLYSPRSSRTQEMLTPLRHCEFYGQWRGHVAPLVQPKRPPAAHLDLIIRRLRWLSRRYFHPMNVNLLSFNTLCLIRILSAGWTAFWTSLEHKLLSSAKLIHHAFLIASFLNSCLPIRQSFPEPGR